MKSIFKKWSTRHPIDHSGTPTTNPEPIKASLQQNIEKVKSVFGNSSDIVVREIRIGDDRQLQAAILYTDGLIDLNALQNFILESLMLDIQKNDYGTKIFSAQNPLQFLKDSVLAVGDIQDVMDFDTLFTSLLSGKAIILVDGYPHSYAVGMFGGENRGVTEPSVETTVRGPRESFTENLRTNTSLIRRKIRNTNLWLESMKIGKITKTDVTIAYIKGIAQDNVVEEVRKRLNRIDLDAVLESGYIEEMIQDESYSPFPTIFNTERPDVLAAGLLEGRVAILVDGTPFVLMVPALFVQFFQSSEDYYQRADIASLLRFLRFFCFFIALAGPSLYIAITTVHQEMIPTQLLISLAAQREGIPFPAFVEALMMEVTFEILREASLRLPRAVGQAVSIVGTLVIGETAVHAGIVSAAMVIVVSLTGIASFVVPSFNLSISVRMIRFALMGMAASFGLYGFFVGIFWLVLHLCRLRSFGVPYMSPIGPVNVADLKDTVFRLPRWGLFSRPSSIVQKNLVRGRNPKPAKKGL
ncbi:spore germination protein [Paenibacillus gyeongsangnamensis]